MMQLETQSSLAIFFNQLLKVSSAIPTKIEVDDCIQKFYNEHNISVETRSEFDMVLQSLGIDKINQEGLDRYALNLISKNSGLSVENSTRIMHGAKTLIANILERKELQEQVKGLKIYNSQREIELKKEIETRNQEINSIVTAQNLLIAKYKTQLNVKDLTAEQLITATEKLLETDVNRLKIKEDVEDFLHGNTNIIIEL